MVMLFQGRLPHPDPSNPQRVPSRLPLDLLVRRPDEIAVRHRRGDPIIREAIALGKALSTGERRRASGARQI